MWASLRWSTAAPAIARPGLRGGGLLGRARDVHLPSEQEKVMPTKRAPERSEEPPNSPLQAISSFCASKIDGSAMRARCGEQPDRSANHGPTSARIGPLVPGPARFGAGVA